MTVKREKTKKKLAWWNYLLWVLGVPAALIALVLLGARLYFRVPVRDYYKASERGFLRPYHRAYQEFADLSDTLPRYYRHRTNGGERAAAGTLPLRSPVL